MKLADAIAIDIVEVFRKSERTPYRTGNLKYNSIKAKQGNSRKAFVIIGGKIARYATYLQNNDYVGKTTVINKHKRFVDKIVDREVVAMIERKYNGRRV